MLACCDALIAAQNAVIAAESLGIGSCYIGDIMEQAETHAELLGLPRYTFPVAMLCFGRPKTRPHLTERYEKHVVHRNAYRRLGADELRAVSDDLDRAYAAHGFSPASPATSRTSTRASSPPTSRRDEPLGGVVGRALDGRRRVALHGPRRQLPRLREGLQLASPLIARSAAPDDERHARQPKVEVGGPD